MSYQIINSIPQFNFQINRILTYGETACNEKEVLSIAAKIKSFSDWNFEWIPLAERAEKEKKIFSRSLLLPYGGVFFNAE